MIQKIVGDGRAFDMHVQYVFDGDKLLGTAGAIKKALPLLDDQFFVLYGDSYLPCCYEQVQDTFIQSGKPGLMTVFHNQGQWDKSNVEYSHGEILVYDKQHQTPSMHYIDYGLGVFSKNAFDNIPDNTVYDLAFLYQQLLAKKQLAACEVQERFYEVGSFLGIEELGDYLKREKNT
jgi:MurNAc alpha-1-phosphate uridylyltransferase